MTTLGEKLREAIEKKQVQATLNAWDKHEDQIRKPQPQEKQMANPNPVVARNEDKPHFAVTNNVMRATFDAIKQEPGQIGAHYARKLAAQGYKEGSVTAVIYQLVKTEQVVRAENRRLTAVVNEYKPIKSSDRRAMSEQVAQRRKKVVLIKRTKREDPAHGIAALTPDTGGPGLPNVEKFDRVAGAMSQILAAPYGKAFHPSAIVDNLSVLHARELYDYLKKIFGGN